MQVEVDNIFEAKVTGITKFGAFVKFENDQTAMVHISEIAPTYVNDISEHLSVGQVVKVKRLSISEDGKISASIKRTLPPPERPAKPFSPRGQAANGQRDGAPSRSSGNHSSGGAAQGGRYVSSYGGQGRFNNARSAQRPSMAAQFPPQPASFEDMLSKFMQVSDDKMADMKKTMNVKHQNNRRGGRRGQ